MDFEIFMILSMLNIFKVYVLKIGYGEYFHCGISRFRHELMNWNSSIYLIELLKLNL